MSEQRYDRVAFLKRLILPGAAAAAARFDPEGEPLAESAPLVVVNAPGVTLSNFRIDGGGVRRTAIEVTGKSDHTLIHGGIIS